jgi:hypothetical protein
LGELSFIGVYPNPYVQTPDPQRCFAVTDLPEPSKQAQRKKIDAMRKEPPQWEPDSNDFLVVMAQSKIKPKDVQPCPTALHLIADMYSFVYQPDGTRRGPLIDRVNILTHGNPQLVGLLGTVKGSDVNFCTRVRGPKGSEIPPRGKPDDSPKDNHFTALDLDFVNWFRGAGDYTDREEGLVAPKIKKTGSPVKRADGGWITGADIRSLFSRKAHMYLYACSIGRSEHFGGGPDRTLINGLAELFGCRVTGFSGLIKFTYSRTSLSTSKPRFEFSLTLATARGRSNPVTDFHQLVDNVRQADVSLVIEGRPRP